MNQNKLRENFEFYWKTEKLGYLPNDSWTPVARDGKYAMLDMEKDWQFLLTMTQPFLVLEEDLQVAKKALIKIAIWELPTPTYQVDWGSNGARDHIISLASKALETINKKTQHD